MARTKISAGESEFSIEIHKPKLKQLTKKHIYIGTSSWKYEGWKGQIYLKEYSQKRDAKQLGSFEKQCLSEYAKVFPTVCNDSTYYRLPDIRGITELAKRTHSPFRFAFKVSQDIVSYRDRKTFAINPNFLNPLIFHENFITPVERAFPNSIYILEFSPVFFNNPRRVFSEPLVFVKLLHKFLEAMPKGYKLAVEVRDPEYLAFEKYWACLEYHKVAHVINAQTWMPPLAEQLTLPHLFTTDFTVVRGLTRPGVKHDEAVDDYKPYTKTVDPYPEARESLAAIIKHCMTSGREAFMYINNRLEGNAPNTIAGVIDQVI